MRIAWGMMKPSEEGLKYRDMKELLENIPSDIEVIPFSILETSLIKSSTVAFGFIHNDHIEELDKVKVAMADICNDFEKETESKTYYIETDTFLLL